MRYASCGPGGGAGGGLRASWALRWLRRRQYRRGGQRPTKRAPWTGEQLYGMGLPKLMGAVKYPARIAFLRKILEEGPAEGLTGWASYYPSAGKQGEYFLYYFDVSQPAEFEVDLPQGGPYRAEIIDPWEMTVTPVEGAFEGKFTLKLPSKPHLAVRIRKVR